MRLKKILIIVVALVMLVGMTPIGVLATADTSESRGFSDMPKDWSTAALQHAVDNGLLQGANGKLNPKGNLTRAEMAAIIARAFNAYQEADISAFKDVGAKQWYAPYIAKANQMLIMQGSNGLMKPTQQITRQEAFVIIARAIKLAPAATMDKSFTDANKIASWAKGEVAALVNAGYVSGSAGKLNPTGYITRAEFAQIMKNIIENYITEAGTYTDNYTGNVIINVPNVTLKGSTINGDLIIGDGVGDGRVTLEDVVVKGRTIIRGGGEHSIVITGNSNIPNIIIARVDGVVRVLAEDGTQIGEVIADGKDDIIVEGKFATVTVVAEGVVLSAKNATIENINVSGANANLVVGAGSTVQKVTLDASQGKIEVLGKVDNIATTTNATETVIEVGEKGTVDKVEAHGQGTEIKGEGKVNSVVANADDIKVDTPNTKVTAGAGTSGVTVGGKEVEAGSTTEGAIPPAPPAPPAPPVDPPVTPTVSAISITTDPTDVSGVANGAEVTVTLATETTGADIYYTLDASDPTATSGSTKYTEPFKVKANDTNGKTVVVKAIGIKSGYTNSDVKSKTITFLPTAEAAANAAITAAKALVPASITVVEGTDTNLLTKLNAIEGMSATGVTLTLDASANANILDEGAITYGESEVVGNVIVKINKTNGTEQTVTVSVTVPAHTPTAEELVNAAITAAEGAIASLTVTNATTAEDMMAAVTGVITNNSITAAWKSGAGFSLTPATEEVTGSITGTIELTLGENKVEVNAAKTIARLPSTNAWLSKVLEQEVPSSNDGGTIENPRPISINVANSVVQVEVKDIDTFDHPRSTATFYGKDSTFTNVETGAVSIDVGSNDIYIKITAEDNTTVLYYKVTIVRAAVPVAGDYDISGLSQTFGDVSAVTIAPKSGKSSGARTIYYEGTGGTNYTKSTTLPSTVGSYAVTFDVAAAINLGWDAAIGLAGGTLTIANANQDAPSGLAGVAPTYYGDNDGKITGVNDTMEYRVKDTGDYTAVTASANEITGLAAGTYEVRYAAKTGYNAGTAAEVTVNQGPNRSQDAPSGLAGVAPTYYGDNDGKITGVNDTMEYRVKDTEDYTAVTASATEITGLAAGTYEVRYAAKTGYNAGTAAEVTVNQGLPKSTATFTLDGEDSETNTDYGNAVTLGSDLKVTGTLEYHATHPSGISFPSYEHHFLVFTIKDLPSTGATVTVEGVANGAASTNTYNLTTSSEVFIWGVEANENIKVTVNYGEGHATMVYTLDLSGVVLGLPPVDPAADVAVAATAVTVGDKLEKSTLSGTFKNAEGTAVAGTLAWTNDQTVVNATGDFGWTFTPTDTTTYNVITGTVNVVATPVPMLGLSLNPTQATAKQGDNLTAAITFSSNYDETGLLTTISLEKSGLVVNFGELFDSLDFTTTIGGTVTGPFAMIGEARNNSSFNYGPAGGAPVTADVNQETTIAAKVKDDAAVGTYIMTIVVNKIDGDSPVEKISTTYTLVVEKEQVTVTFNSNGGSEVAAQTIDKGEKATKPANPTRDGYGFEGWYKEATFDTAWDFDTDTVDENITLYGKWTEWATLFDFDTGTKTITKYNGSATEVVIPASIRVSGTEYNVEAIGAGVFLNNTNITKVTIAEGIESIGYQAFRSAWKITEVTIPNSVTTISEEAFYGTLGLQSVTLPNNLTKIKTAAFSNSGLTSLVLPNLVTEIGERAFYSNNQLTSVTLNDGLVTIGESAFYGAWALKTITIPASIETIGKSAFDGSLSGYDHGLTSIAFAEGSLLKTIGKNAFSKTGLVSVAIPAAVEVIEWGAFANIASLTMVTFAGDNLTELGNYAFYGTNLTAIDLPTSLTTMKVGAFQGNNLTSITIGANVDVGYSLLAEDKNEFKDAYDAASKVAGTYVYSEDAWTKQE